MFKHILIPTDGSAIAAKAIKAGVALAKEMGASVTAYYAIEPLPARLYSEGRIIDRNLINDLDQKARETAENSVRQVSDAAREAGVTCDTVIDRLVSPYRGINEAAAGEKRGRGGIGLP